MTRIGIISDTHGYLPESVFKHFADCDEIWHAGDVGEKGVLEKLQAFKPVRGVYGNIDGADIRGVFPLMNIFMCEQVKVLMTHIGGYPGRYAPGIKDLILKETPQLFISGHSHILKVMYDKNVHSLHINPGAAGTQGWHQVQTLVKLDIDVAEMKNCQVIELGVK